MEKTEKNKENSDEFLITIMKVNEAKDFNEWFERLIVNNKTVQFKIDTGSQVNATVIKKYMESNL